MSDYNNCKSSTENYFTPVPLILELHFTSPYYDLTPRLLNPPNTKALNNFNASFYYSELLHNSHIPMKNIHYFNHSSL